jgi:hypothetical protein
MEQNISSEADSRSASSDFWWNTKFRSRFKNGSPFGRTQNQFKPIPHFNTSIYSNINFNIILLSTHRRSRGSSVSIVTDYGLDDRGFDPRQRQRIFLLAPASRPALVPTQPPVQWVPGVLSPWGKVRPGRDADHSPPSSVVAKNE